MALFLGGDSVRFNLGGQSFKLYIGKPSIYNAKLLSAEDFVLTDKDGLILTVDRFVEANLLSTDNAQLVDSAGNHLFVDTPYVV